LVLGSTIKWKREINNQWCYLHFLGERRDKQEDRSMMIRHIFLEVLDTLGVVEYIRGYDRDFYTIRVKIRNE
jgi:hypothetical protein